MQKKKLTLNKQKITKLTKDQSASIQGGGSDSSSHHDFTCCWCTRGGDGPSKTNCDQDPMTPTYEQIQ